MDNDIVLQQMKKVIINSITEMLVHMNTCNEGAECDVLRAFHQFLIIVQNWAMSDDDNIGEFVKRSKEGITKSTERHTVTLYKDGTLNMPKAWLN